MKQNKTSAPLLDLHGAREDEVFDKVDKFIHKHSQSGIEQVKIMHGKGKGIVKKKVIEYLRLGQYPFKPENGNEGVLIVFI